MFKWAKRKGIADSADSHRSRLPQRDEVIGGISGTLCMCGRAPFSVCARRYAIYYIPFTILILLV